MSLEPATRSTLIRLLVGLAVAIILGFFAGRQQQLLDNDSEILRQLEELRTSLQIKPAAEDINMKISGAPTKGDARAKVALIEFSDFECPFCGRYVHESYPQIDRDYVSTGKIRYVFRHYPLTSIHPRAMKASEAGECAERQGKFWPYHDQLFANQKLLEPASLMDHARAAGLEMKAFETCLGGEAASTVMADLDAGTRAGVEATPTFLFGFVQEDGSVQVVERVVGARPFGALKSVLDRMLMEPQ
jgi:protein-disulfide isomerase